MLRVGDMLTLTPPTIPPPCRQALMKQFKDSVLDEDGLSVRALSEESARRVADQAADGILDLVSKPTTKLCTLHNTFLSTGGTNHVAPHTFLPCRHTCRPELRSSFASTMLEKPMLVWVAKEASQVFLLNLSSSLRFQSLNTLLHIL